MFFKNWIRNYYPLGLENRPEESAKLARYNQLFEIITFAVIITSFIFILLPITNQTLNKNLAGIIIASSTIISVFFYRILPIEKRTGKIQYSFRAKGLLIGLFNPIFISSYILVTGGPFSPFWYIYILVLISAALYLPLWAIFIELVEISILHLILQLLIWPLIFNQPLLTSHFIIAIYQLIASYLAVYLVYNQAYELNLENIQNQQLAGNLESTKDVVTSERNKLQIVLESIVDGIIAIDRKNLSIILVNYAAEKMLGYPKEKIISKHADDAIMLYDDDLRIYASVYCPPASNLLNDKRVYSHRRLRLENPKNNNLYINLNSTSIEESASDNVGHIITLHDISKEKELEQMQLDFVSIAAHELRTPLTSMRGYLALLKEEGTGQLDNDMMLFLERSSIATDQLSALVENLLSVARIERGALTIEMKAEQWEELVKSVVAQFEERASQKNITLTYQPPSDPLAKVAVDHFRITEVVSNLLANAINYTSPNGQVSVSCWQEGNMIVTKVADTGQGIPAAAIPRLFSKFYRVSGVLEQGSKGTGLGLYISKAIVEIHKGKIWVESELGKGSSFYFSIPVATSKTVSPKTTGMIVPKKGPNRTFDKHVVL